MLFGTDVPPLFLFDLFIDEVMEDNLGCLRNIVVEMANDLVCLLEFADHAQCALDILLRERRVVMGLAVRSSKFDSRRENLSSIPAIT